MHKLLNHTIMSHADAIPGSGSSSRAFWLGRSLAETVDNATCSAFTRQMDPEPLPNAVMYGRQQALWVYNAACLTGDSRMDLVTRHFLHLSSSRQVP